MINHLWNRATRLMALLALPAALTVSGCDRDDGLFRGDGRGQTPPPPPPTAPPDPVTFDDDAAERAADAQRDQAEARREAEEAAANQQEKARKDAAEAQKDAAEAQEDAAEDQAEAQRDAAEEREAAAKRDAEAREDAAEDAREAREDQAEAREDAAEDQAEARKDAAEEAQEAQEDRAEQIEERNEAKAKYTDAEVLGLARVLNKGEVDHATAARGRLVDPAVRSFCEMMIQHHGDALRKIDATAGKTGFTPVEGEKAKELVKDVQGKIEDLADEDPKEIDDEFVNHQKAMHEDALKLIDDELRASATSADVVQLLTEMRATVASHLDAIKRIEDAR